MTGTVPTAADRVALQRRMSTFRRQESTVRESAEGSTSSTPALLSSSQSDLCGEAILPTYNGSKEHLAERETGWWLRSLLGWGWASPVTKQKTRTPLNQPADPEPVKALDCWASLMETGSISQQLQQPAETGSSNSVEEVADEVNPDGVLSGTGSSAAAPAAQAPHGAAPATLPPSLTSNGSVSSEEAPGVAEDTAKETLCVQINKPQETHASSSMSSTSFVDESCTCSIILQAATQSAPTSPSPVDFTTAPSLQAAAEPATAEVPFSSVDPCTTSILASNAAEGSSPVEEIPAVPLEEGEHAAVLAVVQLADAAVMQEEDLVVVEGAAQEQAAVDDDSAEAVATITTAVQEAISTDADVLAEVELLEGDNVEKEAQAAVEDQEKEEEQEIAVIADDNPAADATAVVSRGVLPSGPDEACMASGSTDLVLFGHSEASVEDLARLTSSSTAISGFTVSLSEDTEADSEDLKVALNEEDSAQSSEVQEGMEASNEELMIPVSFVHVSLDRQATPAAVESLEPQGALSTTSASTNSASQAGLTFIPIPHSCFSPAVAAAAAGTASFSLEVTCPELSALFNAVTSVTASPRDELVAPGVNPVAASALSITAAAAAGAQSVSSQAMPAASPPKSIPDVAVISRYIVAESGHPAPSWMELATPTDEGNSALLHVQEKEEAGWDTTVIAKSVREIAATVSGSGVSPDGRDEERTSSSRPSASSTDLNCNSAFDDKIFSTPCDHHIVITVPAAFPGQGNGVYTTSSEATYEPATACSTHKAHGPTTAAAAASVARDGAFPSASTLQASPSLPSFNSVAALDSVHASSAAESKTSASSLTEDSHARPPSTSAADTDDTTAALAAAEGAPSMSSQAMPAATPPKSIPDIAVISRSIMAESSHRAPSGNELVAPTDEGNSALLDLQEKEEADWDTTVIAKSVREISVTVSGSGTSPDGCGEESTSSSRASATNTGLDCNSASDDNISETALYNHPVVITVQASQLGPPPTSAVYTDDRTAALAMHAALAWNPDSTGAAPEETAPSSPTPAANAATGMTVTADAAVRHDPIKVENVEASHAEAGALVGGMSMEDAQMEGDDVDEADDEAAITFGGSDVTIFTTATHGIVSSAGQSEELISSGAAECVGTSSDRDSTSHTDTSFTSPPSHPYFNIPCPADSVSQETSLDNMTPVGLYAQQTEALSVGDVQIHLTATVPPTSQPPSTVTLMTAYAAATAVRHLSAACTSTGIIFSQPLHQFSIVSDPPVPAAPAGPANLIPSPASTTWTASANNAPEDVLFHACSSAAVAAQLHGVRRGQAAPAVIQEDPTMDVDPAVVNSATTGNIAAVTVGVMAVGDVTPRLAEEDNSAVQLPAEAAYEQEAGEVKTEVDDEEEEEEGEEDIAVSTGFAPDDADQFSDGVLMHTFRVESTSTSPVAPRSGSNSLAGDRNPTISPARHTTHTHTNAIASISQGASVYSAEVEGLFHEQESGRISDPFQLPRDGSLLQHTLWSVQRIPSHRTYTGPTQTVSRSQSHSILQSCHVHLSLPLRRVSSAPALLFYLGKVEEDTQQAAYLVEFYDLTTTPFTSTGLTTFWETPLDLHWTAPIAAPLTGLTACVRMRPIPTPAIFLNVDNVLSRTSYGKLADYETARPPKAPVPKSNFSSNSVPALAARLNQAAAGEHVHQAEAGMQQPAVGTQPASSSVNFTAASTAGLNMPAVVPGMPIHQATGAVPADLLDAAAPEADVGMPNGTGEGHETGAGGVVTRTGEGAAVAGSHSQAVANSNSEGTANGATGAVANSNEAAVPSSNGMAGASSSAGVVASSGSQAVASRATELHDLGSSDQQQPSQAELQAKVAELTAANRCLTSEVQRGKRNSTAEAKQRNDDQLKLQAAQATRKAMAATLAACEAEKCLLEDQMEAKDAEHAAQVATLQCQIEVLEILGNTSLPLQPALLYEVEELKETLMQNAEEAARLVPEAANPSNLADLLGAFNQVFQATTLAASEVKAENLMLRDLASAQTSTALRLEKELADSNQMIAVLQAALGIAYTNAGRARPVQPQNVRAAVVEPASSQLAVDEVAEPVFGEDGRAESASGSGVRDDDNAADAYLDETGEGHDNEEEAGPVGATVVELDDDSTAPATAAAESATAAAENTAAVGCGQVSPLRSFADVLEQAELFYFLRSARDKVLMLQLCRGFLGITSFSSEADIKRAYKRYVLLYHPDKNCGPNHAVATFTTKFLTEAKNILVFCRGQTDAEVASSPDTDIFFEPDPRAQQARNARAVVEDAEEAVRKTRDYCSFLWEMQQEAYIAVQSSTHAFAAATQVAGYPTCNEEDVRALLMATDYLDRAMKAYAEASYWVRDPSLQHAQAEAALQAALAAEAWLLAQQAGTAGAVPAQTAGDGAADAESVTQDTVAPGEAGSGEDVEGAVPEHDAGGMPAEPQLDDEDEMAGDGVYADEAESELDEEDVESELELNAEAGPIDEDGAAGPWLGDGGPVTGVELDAEYAADEIEPNENGDLEVEVEWLWEGMDWCNFADRQYPA